MNRRLSAFIRESSLDHGILLYYLVTFSVGLVFGMMAIVAFFFLRSPLTGRFLRAYVIFSLFYAAVAVNSYMERIVHLEPALYEVIVETVYFPLLAVLAPTWTSCILELLQRPFKGFWKNTTLGFQALGFLIPLACHMLIPDLATRALFLRVSLFYFYIFAFLVLLALLTVWSTFKIKFLTDPWKKKTLTICNWLMASGIPVFALDSLWPVLQIQYEWVPKAFNFHGLFYVAINVFYARRCYMLIQETREKHLDISPVEASIAPLAENFPRTPLDRPNPERVATLELTDREHSVLVMLFGGLSNREIALRLSIGLGTVKNHIYRIFQKSGASSRKELRRLLA